MRTKSMLTLLCILLMAVGAVQAEIVITNGTFDSNEPAAIDIPDWYDIDVMPTGEADWWNTASVCGSPNPFPDSSAFMGDHLWGGTAGGNRWLYQEIGTKEEGVEYWLSFEYAQPTDGSTDRSVAIQVDVYQGEFAGAAQDVDVADPNQGLTLITSLTSPFESEMVIHSFGAALDLSTANTTDPLWLRISNLDGTGDANTIGNGAFVCVDNVAIGDAPPTVVWVTETRDADEDGVYDDEDWIEFMEAAGYIVKADRDRYLTLGDDKDVNDANDYLGELNAADLVVISRSCSSSKYATDTAEVEAWNSITSPIICLSAYHVRSNKLGWVNGTSAASDNTLPLLSVSDANHPIYAGLSANGATIYDYNDANSPGTTFVTDAEVVTDPETLVKTLGNGTVLGTHLLGSPAWIVEWAPNVAFYEGSALVTGGRRMMFMAGGQETKTDPLLPQGNLNLTSIGQEIFLNAAAYMIEALSPEDPGTDSLTHKYTFEDGTTADLVGGADGTLVGDANVVDGALVCDGDGGYMEMDGSVIDVNSYTELTLVLWAQQDVDNPYTGTATFGSTWSNGYGKDYLMLSVGRGDNNNRIMIANTPDSDSPWADEVGVSSPEMYDSVMHQYVCTVTAETLTYYVDGALIGTAEMGDTTLAGVSNDYAYLGTGAYSVDASWEGLIGSFSMYSTALTEGEVLYLYMQGE